MRLTFILVPHASRKIFLAVVVIIVTPYTFNLECSRNGRSNQCSKLKITAKSDISNSHPIMIQLLQKSTT